MLHFYIKIFVINAQEWVFIVICNTVIQLHGLLATVSAALQQLPQDSDSESRHPQSYWIHLKP